MPHVITETAHAKINLYLHITGRRADGYHELDSLVTFAQIGDTITVTPTNEFSFSCTGEFSQHINYEDNLCIRAAKILSQALDKPLTLNIHLNKNLPVGGGIGGGSADAAATLKALLQFWDVTTPRALLFDMALKLGADVPICLFCENAVMRGSGEIISTCNIPALPILLINPNIFCSTANVFSAYDGHYQELMSPRPSAFKNTDDLVTYLQKTNNQLAPAAQEITPSIAHVLETIKQQSGVLFSSMSGSGATCFAIFQTSLLAKQAAKNIQEKYPAWWVNATETLTSS